jgi:SAM-dependent methyltransferase
VLELGSGCGALTRYLGELGAEVTAVEGSCTRARIAALRCRDLPSVRVCCENLLEFTTEERFDWVLMIGVLEYAPLFSKELSPVSHYLRTAAEFLAPTGALVVAIENQLGLKYLNGCAEDHVGVPFFGVENLYRNGTPVCFGRAELARRIEASGLGALDWLYPFPDYKLPSVIVGARAFHTPGFSVADLLARAQSRDYGGRSVRVFEEGLVFAALERNGLVEALSNAFLVVARRAPKAASPADPIAWSYAVNRHERFATETVFVPCRDGFLVHKAPLATCREADRDRKADRRIKQTLAAAPYRRGRLSIWRILEAGARHATPAEMAEAFRPWFRELLSRATGPSRRDAEIPPCQSRLADFQIDGGLIDCTPFNIIESEGRLDLIDQEWRWDSQVPLGHVVCRGVLHSLSLPLVRSTVYDLGEIVALLCEGEGLSAGAAEVAEWLRREQEFLTAAGVPVPAEATLGTGRGHLLAIYPELGRRIQEVLALRAELARAQAERAAADAMRDAREAQLEFAKARLQGRLRGCLREIAALRRLIDSRSATLLELRRDLADQAAGPEVAPQASDATSSR